MHLVSLLGKYIPVQQKKKLRYIIHHFLVRIYAAKDLLSVRTKEHYVLPPPLLRHRVHGKLDLKSFMSIGKQCSEDITANLGLAGADIQSMENILDFGCGCGRVLQWLSKQNKQAHYDGVDIDEAAINWCNNNILSADFFNNEFLPPLPFDDDKFDLVYAVSVFSHIDEEAHLLWLKEIQRIVRPGGYFVVSYHGRHSQEILTLKEKNTIEEHGFLFKVESCGKFKLDGLPDSYQSAFISQKYIEDHWSSYFDIKKVVAKGMNGYQDIVVMQKRQN